MNNDDDFDYDYKIGDIICNVWKDKFYIIVDFNYKGSLKKHTIKDLSTDKLLIDEWLHSKRLLWNNGNFNGYEREYRISSHGEAVSKERKDKIKKLLDSEND
jgi:hypothetical protein